MTRLHDRRNAQKPGGLGSGLIEEKFIENAGDIMFAQKKKKTKIWIAVPVILALGTGLWLNAGLKDDIGDESIPADSDQYEEDISDLADLSDPSSDPDTSAGAKGQNGAGSETADDSRYGSVSDDFSNDIGSGEFDENRRYEEAEDGTITNLPEDENSLSAGNEREKEYAGKILVIAASDGSVSVRRYDKDGSVISSEKTNIDLSMLTETDQKLFEKGITLNDDAQLSELLQDFEG